MTARTPAANPLASARVRLICAAFVFVAAITLYISTLAPTVTLVDSGELMLAAHTLGVAHPPGFPLYVLLAHIFTWLPIGSVATRVNFASAMFADIGPPYLTLDIRPPQFEIPIRYPLSLITLRRRKSRCAERYDGSAFGDF